MIKDGATIYVSTKINPLSLFTKPLKFLIQLVTTSKFEHVLIYIDGKVSEITGEGGEFESFQSWLKDHSGKYTKFYYKNLTTNLNEDEKTWGINYCKLQVGLKYSAYQASMSWLDDVFSAFKKDSSFARYCVGQSFNFYVAIGRLPHENESLTPAEFLDYQSKSGKFNKLKRLNVK